MVEIKDVNKIITDLENKNESEKMSLFVSTYLFIKTHNIYFDIYDEIDPIKYYQLVIEENWDKAIESNTYMINFIRNLLSKRHARALDQKIINPWMYSRFYILNDNSISIDMDIVETTLSIYKITSKLKVVFQHRSYLIKKRTTDEIRWNVNKVEEIAEYLRFVNSNIADAYVKYLKQSVNEYRKSNEF